MRATRGLPLLLLVLPLGGCFDDPVQQRLGLRFRPDGAVEVEARVRIRQVDGLTEGKAVQERVEALRAELASDGLGWPQRLQGLRPERRRFASERVGDRLEERSFAALVSDPSRLEQLLPDGLVRVEFQRLEGRECELLLRVEPGSRASRRQQELISLREGRVAAAYLDYLEAAEELIALLDDRPLRRRQILWHLVDRGDRFSTWEGEEPELAEEETPIVEAVADAMDAVLDAFTAPHDEEPYTINELSRLVHDPFPFELSLRFPDRPLESEGFLATRDGRTLRAPRRSLAGALEQLSSRWLEPDWLMVLWTGPWRDETDRIDLGELALIPRRADPPASTAELRAALAEALRPPSFLRVRWSSLPPPDADELGWWTPAQRESGLRAPPTRP